MATDDGPKETRELRRMVDHALLQAYEAQVQFALARSRGNVNGRVRAHLQEGLIRLYYALKQWRDNPRVAEDWEEGQLDVVESWINERRQRRVSTAGMGETTDVQEVSAIQAADPGQLSQVIERLRNVANELGLAVDVETPTAHPDENAVDPGERLI